MVPITSFTDKYYSVDNRETMPTEADKLLTSSKNVYKSPVKQLDYDTVYIGKNLDNTTKSKEQRKEWDEGVSFESDERRRAPLPIVSRPQEPSMKPDISFSNKYNSVANRETMPTEAEKQLTASQKQLIKSSSSCITVENADRKVMPANAEELPGTRKKKVSNCCPSGIPRNVNSEYRQLVEKYVIRCSCDTCLKYEVNNVYPVRELWKCLCME